MTSMVADECYTLQQVANPSKPIGGEAQPQSVRRELRELVEALARHERADVERVLGEQRHLHEEEDRRERGAGAREAVGGGGAAALLPEVEDDPP